MARGYFPEQGSDSAPCDRRPSEMRCGGHDPRRATSEEYQAAVKKAIESAPAVVQA